MGEVLTPQAKGEPVTCECTGVSEQRAFGGISRSVLRCLRRSATGPDRRLWDGHGVMDAPADGCKLTNATIVDDFTKKAIDIGVDCSVLGTYVAGRWKRRCDPNRRGAGYQGVNSSRSSRLVR